MAKGTIIYMDKFAKPDVFTIAVQVEDQERVFVEVDEQSSLQLLVQLTQWFAQRLGRD